MILLGFVLGDVIYQYGDFAFNTVADERLLSSVTCVPVVA